MQGLFKPSYEQTLQTGFETVTFRGPFDVYFSVSRVDPVKQRDQFKGGNRFLSLKDSRRVKPGLLFFSFLSIASHVCNLPMGVKKGVHPVNECAQLK